MKGQREIDKDEYNEIPLSNYSQSVRYGLFVISFTYMRTKKAKRLSFRYKFSLLCQHEKVIELEIRI